MEKQIGTLLNNDIEDKSLERKGIFLRDYSKELYASGATTIRIEKNIGRIAKAWNIKADFTILPGHVIIHLWNHEGTDSYVISGRIPPDRINFNTISKLSSLSWEIREKCIDEELAKEKFIKIKEETKLNPWIVLTLFGLANASFCELFGGDLISMAIVFVATVDGFLLKQRLPAMGVDYRIVIVLGACLSALISCSGFVFSLGKTPEIALATSVLYFVPGIPFSNAVCDLIYGHYLNSVSRFLQAMIITVCLSLGLCLAFLILNIDFV